VISWGESLQPDLSFFPILSRGELCIIETIRTEVSCCATLRHTERRTIPLDVFPTPESYSLAEFQRPQTIAANSAARAVPQLCWRRSADG
jgi:hypothetical protein